MNPNFENSGDQPDNLDTNGGGEGELSFSTVDYPQLEGLQPGAPVKVTCQATVKDGGNGQVTLSIDPGSCEFEMEGQADKAMKEMSGQANSYQQTPGNEGGDF